jgi:DnaD/phage-associated family protein
MPSFAGFPSGAVHTTPVPAPFFSELLPQIDHLGELKVTLYALWFLDQQEGPLRYLMLKDLLGDRRLVEGLVATPAIVSVEEAGVARAALLDALDRATRRGTLLRAIPPGKPAEETVFFLNSPRGRAAQQSLARGEWMPGLQGQFQASIELDRPNIFKLYEENIGPLTPLISDELREAEAAYPANWIEDAVRKAVNANARSWRYIDKILRSWKAKGRDDEHRRNPEKDSRSYIEGELSDFIKH